TGGPDMTLGEINEIVEIITNSAGTETDILWGYKVEETISNELTVTVIATRFEEETKEESLEETFGSEIEEKIIIEDELDVPPFLRELQKKKTIPEEKPKTNESFSFFKRMRGE
ncbi:MAG: cell division protein FtsZ, partial [Candidatus Caldatribacteriaceae bacterium]